MLTRITFWLCLTGLQQYDDSSSCLQQSLKILPNTTLDDGNDIKIAHTFNCMDECLLGKQQYPEALIYFQKAHKVCQTQIKWKKNSYLARTLNNLNKSLLEFQKYAVALKYLNELLAIYKKPPLNEHKASKMESACCKIDKCSLKLG